MQPQDPNAGYNPQVGAQPQPQPTMSQAPAGMPVQQAAPMQPQMPQAGYPYQPQAAAMPMPMISIIVGAVALITFGVLFGMVLGGTTYFLLLIPLLISLAGGFLAMQSLTDATSVINKLALIGFIVSVSTACLSLSFTVGMGVVKAKASSYSSSY